MSAFHEIHLTKAWNEKTPGTITASSPRLSTGWIDRSVNPRWRVRSQGLLRLAHISALRKLKIANI